MNKYASPELKVTFFEDAEIFCASISEDTSSSVSSKKEVTGDGPGIVLPDDEW